MVPSTTTSVFMVPQFSNDINPALASTSSLFNCVPGRKTHSQTWSHLTQCVSRKEPLGAHGEGVLSKSMGRGLMRKKGAPPRVSREEKQDAQIAKLDNLIARDEELKKDVVGKAAFFAPDVERLEMEVRVIEKAIMMREHLLGKRKKGVGFSRKDVEFINKHMTAPGIAPVIEDDPDIVVDDDVDLHEAYDDDFEREGDDEDEVDDDEAGDDTGPEGHTMDPSFLGGIVTVKLLETRDLAPIRYKAKTRKQELYLRVAVAKDEWRDREVLETSHLEYATDLSLGETGSGGADRENGGDKSDGSARGDGEDVPFANFRILPAEQILSFEVIHPVDGQTEHMGKAQLDVGQVLEAEGHKLNDWFELKAVNEKSSGEGAVRAEITITPFERTPKGLLKLQVHNARGLKLPSGKTPSQPYVAVYLEDNATLPAKDHKAGQTDAVKSAGAEDDPSWDNFFLNMRLRRTNTRVAIEAFDYAGPGKKDVSLGTAMLELEGHLGGDESRIWLNLDEAWGEEEDGDRGGVASASGAKEGEDAVGPPRGGGGELAGAASGGAGDEKQGAKDTAAAVEISLVFLEDPPVEEHPDYHGGRATVEVMAARHLAAVDRGKKGLAGTSDPYVAVSVGNNKREIGTTHRVKKNCNPEWSPPQEFTFRVPPADKAIVLEALSHSVGGDKTLGHTAIACPALPAGERVVDWHDLYAAGRGKPGQGAVQVAVTFLPGVPVPDGVLAVEVHGAKHLVAANQGNPKKGVEASSDTFVRLSLEGWYTKPGAGKEFGETTVVPDTLEPTWNDESSFCFTKVDKRSCDVIVEIFHKPKSRRKFKPVLLGRTTVPVQEYIGKGTVRGWFELADTGKGAKTTNGTEKDDIDGDEGEGSEEVQEIENGTQQKIEISFTLDEGATIEKYEEIAKDKEKDRIAAAAEKAAAEKAAAEKAAAEEEAAKEEAEEGVDDEEEEVDEEEEADEEETEEVDVKGEEGDPRDVGE